MHRLFIALRPPAALRRILSGTMGGVGDARWQTDDQLHLTLSFIGDVDRHVLADIDLALGRVRGAPVPLALAGAGSFGRATRPRSIWIGVAPDPALLHLQRSVQRALVIAGAPPDRRAYAPHVTVARLGRSSGPVEPWLARHAAMATDAHAIDSILLYESHLGATGSLYEPIGRYALDRA